jgi:hypothetical protein
MLGADLAGYGIRVASITIAGQIWPGTPYADLMQSCRQALEPQLELFREAGAFAGQLPVPPGATGQTRFLAMLSRAGRRR